MQAHHSLVNSRLSLATTKICKIRIMLEMEKDENKHRARKWYVARGVDEGKVSLKEYDNGKTGGEGTPQEKESRATSSGDVHMSEPQQQQHDNARICEESR